MNTPQSLEERSDFLARCTRCSQCKFVAAPKSQRHASACPSMDYGQFHAYSGGGQVIMAYGLLDGAVQYSSELLDAVASCTMCGNCDVSCKVNFAETVEPLDSLYALRAKIVKDGQSPAAHRTLIENLRRTGNAQGKPQKDRGRWAEGLALKQSASADIVLHVGSEIAYAPERWDAVRRLVHSLGRAGIAGVHLGAREGSSGSLAFDLGYVEDAAVFAQAMVSQVLSSGAKTLVTFSAEALAAFRGIYPRLGLSFGTLRILHITEYVLEQIQSGRLSVVALSELQEQPIAYHDPCKLGRLSEPWLSHDVALSNEMNGVLTSRAPQALRFGNNGCYEAPRALLRAMGAQLVELERHHASSYCCGAGGGVKEAMPDAAALAAKNRLAELDDGRAATLVSACGKCAGHLQDHAGGTDLTIVNLLDLLGQSIQPSA